MGSLKGGNVTIQEIREVLFEIEELAGKSQGIWDHAWTNAVVADHPDKDRWTQQTYEATRIHAACMDVLRTLAGRLQRENEERIAGMTDLQRAFFAAGMNGGAMEWRS